MNKLWKTFDLTQAVPKYLDEQSKKTCIYAKEYISEGYSCSSDNQLIFNFKKPSSKKGKPEWCYKEEACIQFANDLANLFGYLDLERITFTTIPTSKLKTHAQFDPRFEMMREHLLKLGNNENNPQSYCYEEPIGIKDNMLSASTEHGDRNMDTKYNNYQCNGFNNSEPEVLFIIDDVITTGCQFMAYKKLLLEQYPGLKTVGVFWAKARQRNGQELFSDSIE